MHGCALAALCSASGGWAVMHALFRQTTEHKGQASRFSRGSWWQWTPQQQGGLSELMLGARHTFTWVRARRRCWPHTSASIGFSASGSGGPHCAWCLRTRQSCWEAGGSTMLLPWSTRPGRGSFISHRLLGAKERLFWLRGWGTAAAMAVPGALKGQTSIFSLSAGCFSTGQGRVCGHGVYASP